MKSLSVLCVLLGVTFYSIAQQPFRHYGYEVEISKLSDSRFSEDFTTDSLVQVGSVMLNRVTGKIVAFVTYDTLYSESSLDPHLVSRWMSPDPLAEKFYPLSPYNYVANNPILYIDPDGRELVVHFKGQGSSAKFMEQINAMFNNQFKLTFTQVKDKNGDAVAGKYTVGIEATEGGGDLDKLTDGEQTFYKGLKQVIDHKVIVGIDVFNGNADVATGNYDNNAIDVGDMEQWPKFDRTRSEQEGTTGAAKMLHEVREQFNKALDGVPKGSDRYKNRNHERAIGFENSVNNTTRMGDGLNGGMGRGIVQSFKRSDGSIVRYVVIGGPFSQKRKVISVTKQ